MPIKNRCMGCGQDFYDSCKTNMCRFCEQEKAPGFPTMIETDSLYTMKNVSRNRLKELDKRVMLPDAVKDKDYVCGSKQNGKITDRQIDVRP